MLEATSTDPNFLEACVRFLPDGGGEGATVFLSSGTED
jgi:hypothetical protein